ncbi:CysS/YqeB C-terminal domain-containing protein [Streptomyces zaomyceticus]|uniref:CysS/YqeB C-terminal domain-containing protein n=1 Tax=Streptomyces zaomyceticus TaxID=68286 RepID=UPI00344246D0
MWVDGTPALDESTHALLRKRRRAIADDRTGAAEEAREELRARGISVRDRGEAQQYREV